MGTAADPKRTETMPSRPTPRQMDPAANSRRTPQTPTPSEMPGAQPQAEKPAAPNRKKRKRGASGGRNPEQIPSRARKREAKQIAWMERQAELQEQAERDRLAAEEAARTKEHHEPEGYPAPLQVPLEARDEADLDDTIPLLKKLSRPNGVLARSLHLDVELNREFNAWMAREGGLVFIPTVSGMIRSLLREDFEYQARVKSFEDLNGRPPTAAEVRRGSIHHALQAEMHRMIEGEPFPPKAGA